MTKEVIRLSRLKQRRWNTYKDNRSDLRPFNAYLKPKAKSKTCIDPLKIGDALTSDDGEMADILNNSLANSFTLDGVNI